jgi:catechol-2,3-dioxygenase
LHESASTAPIALADTAPEVAARRDPEETAMSAIRPRQLAHVVYRTRRFGEMIEWYRKAFHARVGSRNGGLAFLSYDDEHHRFALVDLSVHAPLAESVPERRSVVGLDHVAYTYASLDDLLENYAELKAEGILPYWCVHHGLTISMYYADPDGNQMEFQVDAFATPEALKAYMTGPRFGVNPVGVEFDPDVWLARLRSGTPSCAMLVRESDQPVSPIRSAGLA